jgi:monofunctional biosynthetic peptidoglycan transglycosylase
MSKDKSSQSFKQLMNQSGHRKFSVRKIIKWLIIGVPAVIMLYLAIVYFNLPDVEYLKTKNPKTTAMIEARLAQAAEQKKRLKIRQQWVRFKNIPDLLKKAVRISEDAGFYQHEGVDFDEMKESFERNLKEGKIVRGGSTITQQLAKNLYLSTDRSYARKLKEYFIAGRLEDNLSKNRIFHLYLNVIEFGRGIFGVQSASRFYFKKNVSNLNLEQIVRLVAVIPRPLSMNPKSESKWLKWRCRWILSKLKKYKYITNEQYNNTISSFE